MSTVLLVLKLGKSSKLSVKFPYSPHTDGVGEIDALVMLLAMPMDEVDDPLEYVEELMLTGVEDASVANVLLTDDGSVLDNVATAELVADAGAILTLGSTDVELPGADSTVELAFPRLLGRSVVGVSTVDATLGLSAAEKLESPAGSDHGVGGATLLIVVLFRDRKVTKTLETVVVLANAVEDVRLRYWLVQLGMPVNVEAVSMLVLDNEVAAFALLLGGDGYAVCCIEGDATTLLVAALGELVSYCAAETVEE